MSADRIDRIGIGSGTPEGKNSAYLVDDRLVVDPGPPTDRAWTDLREGLERAGVSLPDLEYVLVSHWHVDHAGLAPRLAEAADATLAMGEADAPLVAAYGSERERRLERDRETMRRWGVPAEIVEDIIEGDSVSPMPESIPVERLEEGDTIAGLEAVPTPGHTLGHTAFAGEEFVLVGDAVLPTYTPNVGGSDTRTLAIDSGTKATGSEEAADFGTADADPLSDYFETLERLEKFEDRSKHLLPGHGTEISDGRTTAIRDHHRARSRRVLARLERDESEGDVVPATPWKLAVDLFGDLEGIHAKFGAGEAAAHCRRLQRTGAIVRVGKTPLEYESRP
ncbi:MBL fold metallo-hydrolase [Natronorubrum sp. JWXQ-INN-674]|uniref:MBL fold metallo-hydrolase n=1 Tax=Natronorubrum halalkaliphilum TaxID=2691917 RepID=A0A6B0VRC8_9EURY|nr:MBL fold metallo-hydrolase [Natronorubrum halalkaliphilum]MXV64401.1 MBL fold metallo-hydrolase [Natronorubrum halalkaliphilum]